MEATMQNTAFPTMVVIPKLALDELTASINELKELVMTKAKEEATNEWLESGEARKILGVSQKTWQTYRDKKVIPFSQFGRKIYVKRSDIEGFLKDHSISKNV